MKKRVPAFGFWGLCHNNTTRFLQLQGFDRIFVEFLQKIYGRRKKASPFRGGGSAERRDGEVAADLRRPLSQPAADSVPTPFVPSGHFPLIGGIGP